MYHSFDFPTASCKDCKIGLHVTEYKSLRCSGKTRFVAAIRNLVFKDQSSVFQSYKSIFLYTFRIAVVTTLPLQDLLSNNQAKG